MKSRKPSVQTKKEKRQKRRRYILTMILLVFIMVDFVWIMNNERFHFSYIDVSGNDTILTKDIEQKVNTFLSGAFLGILSKNNVLLLNTKKLKREILNSFPKIYNAKIFIKNNSILVIEIEEREPHSLWCKNEDDVSDFDEECYFADQRGYIYTRAPYFSHGVFEKIYTTEDVLKIGEQVMDRNAFKDFFYFTDELYKEYNISVNHIFIDEKGEVRLYLSSLLDKVFKENPYIIYKNKDSYESILLRLGIMLNHKMFKQDWEKMPERLLFIDLRIENQIRFKFMTDEEFTEKQKQEEKKNEKQKQTTE